MEKRRKTEAVDGEILLPEPIIQHVQSFLTGKESAQTTILSKSWYSAWLTRPNLDFDQRDYRIRGFTDRCGYHEFAKKTMKRYQQLNLKIDSFKLFINDFSLGKALIVKAMKMGAVDLHFETTLSTFVLPHEVLESENLLRLSVTGCKIDAKVAWSSLKSFSLCRVSIEGDIIWDIISICPLIEKLVLSECKCLLKSQSPHSVTSSTKMLALNHCLINLYEFRKLKCLFLEKVKISSLFFSDFSMKFPCLKDLTVCNCFGYKEIQIYSPSLECITFEHKRILRAKFDVPNIRKFRFSGSNVPSLSFERPSRECKFEISIAWKRFRTSWFLKLSKFLGELSQSILSLTLIIGTVLSESLDFTKDVGLPKPVVENLMVEVASSVSSSLLDGLFWCFHPKSIYQCWMPKSCTGEKGNNDLLELLCKTLIQEGSEGYCCIPNRNMSALHDLEEVNVDILEDSLGEFRPLPWKMLLDASASPERRRAILFNLKWGIDASTIK
ncbi:hypothetical protein C2S52_014615 [Perilla frutescens var. hirtella]|nr:hypothetical protein C2S52_014615 [Perilla frutescens var. hirtella]